MARTSTIPAVEIVSVGKHYGSTGTVDVTIADLEAMLAADADGLVDHAPVKLGHRSALNAALGDGAPAYGWVKPTGIITNAEGRKTLVGDLHGVPAELAEIAPTAYRRRSAEIAWGVKTPAGKAYAAAIVGLALLGATPPAVKGLADIVALYADGVTPDNVTTIDVVDGITDNPQAVAMLSAAVAAGATIDQVDGYARAAGASDTAHLPPPVSDAGDDGTNHPSTGNDGRNTMPKPPATDDEFRSALGLAADADVSAALKSLLSEREEGTEETDAEKATREAAEKAAADKVDADAKAKAEADAKAAADAGDPPADENPETVQLSAAQYKNLTELADATATRNRSEALNKAIRSGRIAPSERQAYADQMARDEVGTMSLLSALAPARFPVTLIGDELTADTALSAATTTALDDFEADTFGFAKS